MRAHRAGVRSESSRMSCAPKPLPSGNSPAASSPRGSVWSLLRSTLTRIPELSSRSKATIRLPCCQVVASRVQPGTMRTSETSAGCLKRTSSHSPSPCALVLTLHAVSRLPSVAQNACAVPHTLDTCDEASTS